MKLINKRLLMNVLGLLTVLGILNLAHVNCGSGFSKIDLSSELDATHSTEFVQETDFDNTEVKSYDSSDNPAVSTSWRFSVAYDYDFGRIKAQVEKSNPRLTPAEDSGFDILSLDRPEGSVKFDASWEPADNSGTRYATTTIRIRFRESTAAEEAYVEYTKSTVHYSDANRTDIIKVGSNTFTVKVHLPVPTGPNPRSREDGEPRVTSNITVTYKSGGAPKTESYNVRNLYDKFYSCDFGTKFSIVLENTIENGKWKVCKFNLGVQATTLSDEDKKCSYTYEYNCPNYAGEVNVYNLNLRSESDSYGAPVVVTANRLIFATPGETPPPPADCTGHFHVKGELCVLNEGVFKFGSVDIIDSDGEGTYCRYSNCDDLARLTNYTYACGDEFDFVDIVRNTKLATYNNGNCY